MSLFLEKNKSFDLTHISPPESAPGLWYDPCINRFEDDTGVVLHDLSLYFPTWQLDQWKKGKDYAVLKDRRGEVWELYYNTLNKCRHCQHFCEWCESKCELYDMMRDW